jgi:hypothetical protein
VIDFVSRLDGLTLGLVVFALVLGESLIVTDLVVPGEIAGGTAPTSSPRAAGLAACARRWGGRSATSPSAARRR